MTDQERKEERDEAVNQLDYAMGNLREAYWILDGIKETKAVETLDDLMNKLYVLMVELNPSMEE